MEIKVNSSNTRDEMHDDIISIDNIRRITKEDNLAFKSRIYFNKEIVTTWGIRSFLWISHTPEEINKMIEDVKFNVHFENHLK